MKSSINQNRVTSLPIRITLIVYWYLVIISLLITVPVMFHIENDLANEISYKSKSAKIEIQGFLYQNPSASPTATQDTLDAIRTSLDIPAIELRIGTEKLILSGKKSAQLVPDATSFTIHSDAIDQNNIQLVVHHPSIKSLTYNLRRNFLLFIGTFFIVFGAILAVVLRRIIARPFTNMVKTAEKFSAGNQDARFSIDTDDEFAYLSKFFNRILDQLLLQQKELKAAFTYLQQSESTLSKEKERIEVTLDSIADGVITTNHEGTIEYFNPAAERLLDTTLTTAKGCFIGAIVSLVEEETLTPIDNPVLDCLKENKVIGHGDKTILTTVGNKHRAISYIVAPMDNAHGDVIGAVMVLHDAEQTRQLSRQLTYQASHDPLTNLYNRRAFEEHLTTALDSAIRDNKYHAICYLDLDQFKIVNDTCGHVAGDALLQQLAELLRSRIRNSDILARLGGDEFGVLLQYCDANHAEKVANDFVKAIGNYRFSWEGRLFETGVSIGLVSITSETQTVNQILSSADMACYIAKEKGRSQIHIYQPNDAELNQRRGEMQWVPKIKEALEFDKFVLYQQPIVDISPTNTDQLHFEVLLRLLDETNTIVPPMAFIPAAERFQLMPSIDRWVITNTFSFLNSNMPCGAQYTCSINLSGQSLSDDKFMNFVDEALSANNISPENICFEITETAAITHLDKAIRFINYLHRLGCKFSLDDFGSGLSSFSYLKDLNVNYLKIDGVFIKDMVTNPVDYAMVKSINEIGQVMDLKIIAEFVENKEIVDQLKILGINYAQGYCIAKPLPIETILKPPEQKCCFKPE